MDILEQALALGRKYSEPDDADNFLLHITFTHGETLVVTPPFEGHREFLANEAEEPVLINPASVASIRVTWYDPNTPIPAIWTAV